MDSVGEAQQLQQFIETAGLEGFGSVAPGLDLMFRGFRRDCSECSWVLLARQAETLDVLKPGHIHESLEGQGRLGST